VIEIGIIGHGFMASAHARAWTIAPQVFDLELTPHVAVLAGRDPHRTAAAASRLRIDQSSSNWREVIADDRVQVIDVCTPVDSHAEIVSAALAAGKHVLCEKPLSLNTAESARLAAAAEIAHSRGVVAMVGYNYRRVPALQVARSLCQDGDIGRIRQIRMRYLQDWLVASEAPWSWRLDAKQAGAGALGDIGSHLIDLAQFLIDDPLESVVASAGTAVHRRPTSSGSELREVTVDDTCSFLAVSVDGARCSFETSRLALGRKNQLQVEIDGERGSLAFDLERLNELQLYTADRPIALRGFRTILVTEPSHPYMSGWWPPGHVLGWHDTFVNQARDFIAAVAAGQSPRPSFEDAHYVQVVIEAVQRSADEGSWQAVRWPDTRVIPIRSNGALGPGTNA
jgi:predicted dehydrogenase